MSDVDDLMKAYRLAHLHKIWAEVRYDSSVVKSREASEGLHQAEAEENKALKALNRAIEIAQ